MASTLGPNAGSTPFGSYVTTASVGSSTTSHCVEGEAAAGVARASRDSLFSPASVVNEPPAFGPCALTIITLAVVIGSRNESRYTVPTKAWMVTTWSG